MRKLKSFDEFMNEGVMPDWARPTSDLTAIVRKDNFQGFQDERQSMTRFTVGDRITEIESGLEGIITSMGDGMNTITWKSDSGDRHDSYPQELDKLTSLNPTNESLNEASVTLDTIDPNEKTLVQYLKKNKIKSEIVNPNGPGGGHPEVKFTANEKTLKKMIDDYWMDDYLYTFIEK